MVCCGPALSLLPKPDICSLPITLVVSSSVDGPMVDGYGLDGYGLWFWMGMVLWWTGGGGWVWFVIWWVSVVLGDDFDEVEIGVVGFGWG